MLKVQEIREIINLIDQSTINEFTYESEGTTVSLKKSGGNPSARLQEEPVTETLPVLETPVKEPDPVKEESKKEESKEVKEEEQNEDNHPDTHEIVSPMVGTFYNAPSPESGPYVTTVNKLNDSLKIETR